MKWGSLCGEMVIGEKGGKEREVAVVGGKEKEGEKEGKRSVSFLGFCALFIESGFPEL